ncbi:hypothetical protein HPB49_003697 [Dermacentor silvarum]|uniref:Uncharacterized protein n=1 Tax=Dermacentor silvarum TaxID=543639 RepID=A0ACB8DTK0_DERSI|nr:hypothetical protein HPB49_003697 [Dermacentor silvarum]
MSHILIKWVAEEKWDVYPVRALADTNVGYRLVAQEGAIKKLRGSIQDVFWEEGQPAAPAILLNSEAGKMVKRLKRILNNVEKKQDDPVIACTKVDIGGGTLIDKSVLEQLSRACDSGSGPGKFARALLRHIFTDAELRGKSLFGGKGCHRGEAVQKEALDTVRVEAVIGCQNSFADLALPLAPREQPQAAEKAPAVEARAPKPTKVPQVGSLVESTAAPAVPAVRAPTGSVPPKSATPSGTQLERVPSVSRLSEEAMDTTPSTSGTPTPKHPPLPTGRGKAGRQPVAAPEKGT